MVSPTGLSPSTAGHSRPLRLPWIGPLGSNPSRGAATPHTPTVIPWGIGLGSPPFGRPYSGDPYWFLFLPLLRCFRSGGSRPQRGRHGLFARSGRSHSGIPGSTAACAYPGLIAACHALPRRPSRAIHRTASVPQALGRGPSRAGASWAPTGRPNRGHGWLYSTAPWLVAPGCQGVALERRSLGLNPAPPKCTRRAPCALRPRGVPSRAA